MPVFSSGAVRRRSRFVWRAKLATALVFGVLVLTLGFFMARLDEYLLPQLAAQTDEMARNLINMAIDQALADAGEGLQAWDFFTVTQDEDGMVNSLIVDTMLVNSISNDMAVSIGGNIGPPTVERVRLPLGSLLGIAIFANYGPEIPVSFRYIGGVSVDYETEFRSVGINQVNFQLWVSVQSSVRVVNPLEEKDVTISRRIALVDTVFSGRVPQAFLNIDRE